jgi:hypothetical protein
MWTAIELIALEEISSLSPPLSKAQEDFFFEGFLVVLDALLKYHYRPEVFPASQEVVMKIIPVMCDICNRLTPTLTDANNTKMLSVFMLTLVNVTSVGISPHIRTALSEQLQNIQQGLVIHPAQLRFDDFYFFATVGLVGNNCRRRYRVAYQTQLELTQSFRHFAANILRVYQGQNTIDDQLSAHSVRRNIRLLAYSDVGNAEVN